MIGDKLKVDAFCHQSIFAECLLKVRDLSLPASLQPSPERPAVANVLRLRIHWTFPLILPSTWTQCQSVQSNFQSLHLNRPKKVTTLWTPAWPNKEKLNTSGKGKRLGRPNTSLGRWFWTQKRCSRKFCSSTEWKWRTFSRAELTQSKGRRWRPVQFVFEWLWPLIIFIIWRCQYSEGLTKLFRS